MRAVRTARPRCASAPAGWEAIRDYVAFSWNAMDAWFEEDEQVFVHPRNPYARVDALRSTRTIRVELDGVLENAVVGVAHEKWGEVGRAFVVLKAGANLDEAAVIEHCGGQLARYKVPKEVRFIDGLPHNATGKVMKHQLPRS